MNILIPHAWLLEHLDTDASPEQIAQFLSLSGPSVERIEIIKNEPVYDIEVTTNRVDAMSVRGIAREAAAILPRFQIEATLKPLTLSTPKATTDFDIEIIDDPDLSRRILAIKLEAVTLKESPDWLQKRLIQVGQRPLNNIIDITNYVMWEIGHPVHAFDYDQLNTKKILVRLAKKGEKVITLDDRIHVMKGGEVVYDDGQGNIIDLPGIMGTANTVVSSNTKNVLLWIEANNPDMIRDTSMTHDIRTQAAILNEKNVDPHLGEIAIKKALSYYEDLARPSRVSRLIDIFPHPPKPQTIILPKPKLDTYLGLSLSIDQAELILKLIGCEVSYSSRENNFTVIPPTYRSHDLTIYQDLIEEIARIYGYHELDGQPLQTNIPLTSSNADFNLEYKLKTWLSGFGFQEIYTYSMVSQELALQSGYPLKDHLQIANPLTTDGVYMRRSLIPSLLQVISDNPQSDVLVFELQNVYHPRKDSALPLEAMTLSLVSNQNYLQFKGYVEALLDKLYLSEVKYSAVKYEFDYMNPDRVASILVQGHSVGHLGETRLSSVFAASLDLNLLLRHAHRHPPHLTIYPYPAIIEDLTFTLPTQTNVGPIVELISEQPLVHQVQYLTANRYGQNITLRLFYRHPGKSLTVDDVAPVRALIVKKLAATFGAKLVGQI